MPDRLKRTSFVRIAVVMAGLAFPLLAVGSAQAAIAGAPPESTSNRPDLVSVKVLDSTDADFCFDKTLNNVGISGANFAIGGYNASRFLVATAAALEQTFDTSGKCVRAIFTAGNTGGATIGDITQYTIGAVNTGAVQTGAAITNPEIDSAPLTFPASMTPTHNGTAGFTAGPDLTSVLVDPTTNTITYVFDQNVDTAAAPVPGDFTFTRSGGTQCGGLAVVAASGQTVTVQFGPVATCPVTDAQRAGTTAGALPMGASADPGNPSTPSEVIVPASATSSGTGTTAAPDLVGAQLTNSGSDLNFTFDKTVTVGTPAHFHAVVSISGSAGIFTATSCSAINTTNTSTTVQCQFNTPPMSEFSEYVVKAAVDAGAVTETSAPNIPNTPDALAAGDNTGAFARGFTTGPDVLGGLLHTTTGVLTLALDQRVFTDVPGNIHLVDGTGFDTTPAGASSVAFPAQAAGPESVTVQFSPGQASTAKNVSVRGGSLFTLFEPNVPQVLSITTTSSIVKHLKSAKHMSRRAAARSNARSRAKNRAIVRRLMRHP